MEKYHIDMRNITLSGRVLDIGGGGEGIIARHLGDNVIVIDKLKTELDESPDKGIKIVMDATNLQFIDGTFHHATCFYSLMYMDEPSMEKVIIEAYRVLKPGGSLLIWDATIPFPPKDNIFITYFEIILSNEVISTGYGVGWRRRHDLSLVSEKCEKAGFTINQRQNAENRFFLTAVKDR